MAQNIPDLTRANISWEETEHTVMDRPLWRQAAAQCAYTGAGGTKSKSKSGF